MHRNYLKILICQDEKFKNCCREDLKNDRKHFKAGQEDTFDLGHSTGDCQKFKVIKKCFIKKKSFQFQSQIISNKLILLNFKVHHITKFRIDLVDFNPADEEPWYGEFIEIRFSNKSTYHCGVENYNEISDSVELTPTCKLEI